MAGQTTLPGAPTGRWARNRAEGLATAARPRSPISKTPTSSVAPKRFFTARKSLRLKEGSLSK